METSLKMGILAFLATSIASCSSTDETSVLRQSWQHRYGPSPAMSQTEALASASSQKAIVSAFLSVNGDQTDYFGATLAGYNFVDEQCDTYMRALFVLDKDRELTKSGIDAIGQVTNAIIGVIPASKLTMGVVTQAFGLGGQFADDMFKGYLYGSSPGTISHVVDTLRAKYRSDTANAKSAINAGGVPTSYAYIRGYLRLCLPSTISASIDNALSGTKAATEDTGTTKPAGKGISTATETNASIATTPQNKLVAPQD